MGHDQVVPESLTEPTLFVGCAMWANRAWVGPYLPAETKPAGQLAAYARWCNAVEGNTTFYGLPAQRSVERWAEQAPAGFRFVFKVPREITHERRLRGVDDELAAFCARMAPLGARLGPTSVQLPASFGPRDLPVLEAFLCRLPHDRPWAVEVRHPAFSAGGDVERALNDVLHDHGVNRVLLDSRALFAAPAVTPAEVAAYGAKPRLAVRPVATGPYPIIRFIGQSAAAANPAFWQPWLAKLALWLGQGRSPFFFVHTPDNSEALGLAATFRRQAGGDPGPLPAANPAFSEQLPLIDAP